MGPFPPWVPLGPFGSLGSPWGVGVGVGVGPWGAFGSQGSRSSMGDKIASQSLAGGAKIAGENILGRRHARSVSVFLHFVVKCPSGFALSITTRGDALMVF